MASTNRIIFRADGNSRIGLGHVTRSLALAHMLRNEYECVFAIQSPDAALKEHIRCSCHGIIILPICAATEERFNHELDAYISEEEIVVLDGYQFNTSYQQNIKSRGAVLVCIDDIKSYPFVADVVLNPAGGVEPSQYNLAPYSKLLLGPAYALLRTPFLRAKSRKKSTSEKKLHVLLCMGGADPEQHTVRIAEEIQQLQENLILEIVVGSAFKHQQSLYNWLEKNESHNLHTNLNAVAMADLMSRCQAAVTSASGVAYEYAAVGGALFVLKTADNQEALYKYLISTGLAIAYDVFTEEISKDLGSVASKLQQKQEQIFDGQSATRLKALFATLHLQTNLKIRQVAQNDLMLLFDWSNDPEVRRYSFNSATIPFEVHTSWFESKLNNSKSKLYIAEVQGKPAAHIRFELSDHIATISYLISSSYRGKGLGHEVLLKGIKAFAKDGIEIKQVEGLVQKTNKASVRAFEKAGFIKSEPDNLFPDAYKFTLQVN